MPLITAAVLAVGAAIATTTLATVATAIVAVSAAVGVAGLAVTAVGMITKNETLLKVGKVMGYVGLAGGLAGGVVGGIGGLAAGTGFFEGAAGAYTGAADFAKQGWDKGIGSIFNPATGTEVAGPLSGAAGQTGQTAPAGVVQGPYTGQVGAIPQGNMGGVAGTSVSPEGWVSPGIPAQAPLNAPINPGAAAATGPSIPTNALTQVPASPSVGNAVDYGAEFLKGTGTNASMLNPAAAVGNAGNYGAEFLKGTGTNASMLSPAAATAKGMFDGMPDYMKYAAITTGMQGISGLASGWFQGASQEEQLEFQKLVNAQREAQVQLQNKNANFVPTLNFRPTTFPGGVLNS